MKNLPKIIGVVAIFFLLGAGCFNRNSKAEPKKVSENPQQGQQENQQPVDTGYSDPDLIYVDANTKIIKMTAKQFSFEPSKITLKKGDRVRLEITSIDTDHSFVLQEFGIHIPLFPNKTVFVDFDADKVGTFKFYCSVICGEGHSDMNGQLIVE